MYLCIYNDCLKGNDITKAAPVRKINIGRGSIDNKIIVSDLVRLYVYVPCSTKVFNRNSHLIPFFKKRAYGCIQQISRGKRYN